MVLENTAMGDFYGCLEGLGLLGFEQFAVDGTALVLDVFLTIQRVGNHVSYDFN